MMTANQKLTAAGAFIPLEDLIEEHAPNLKKHYEKYWNMMKDPNDGHIYNLPNYGVTNADVNSSWYSGPAFWIQKDVLAEAGYPEVKTLDQYFDLIKQYKEKHPTIDGTPTIGFEILNYDWKNWGLFNAPQHLIGHPNDGGVVVKDGKAEILPTRTMPNVIIKAERDECPGHHRQRNVHSKLRPVYGENLQRRSPWYV